MRRLLAFLLLALALPARAAGTPVDALVHLRPAGQAPSCVPHMALTLAPGVASGSWQSPAWRAPFPFTVALPSWNGEAPAGSGFRVAMRFQDQVGAWTDWLEVGDWGPVPPRPSLATRSGPVQVEIDTVKASTSLVAYAWRVDLAAGATASAVVRRLSVCLTGTGPMADRYLLEHPVPPAGEGAIELPAPFRGQVTPVAALTGRICSPCTVASALGAYGIEVPTEVVAADLYDPLHDLFGVWPRAIMGASQRGLEGYVTRIRDYGTLRAHFLAGHVVGASIRFKPGTLKHPPYPSTNGHLILLRGFTAGGDVITADSYRAADGDGKIWDQGDLARAWFATGGVAYVFEGRGQRP